MISEFYKRNIESKLPKPRSKDEFVYELTVDGVLLGRYEAYCEP